jgi:valyl-tRNA synthetase
MNLEDYKGKKPKKLEKIDELFLEELNKVIIEATKSFEEYEYSKAKSTIENFFWKDFADNYVEIVKSRVYGTNEEEKNSALYTLYTSFFTIIKLFAPLIPFITEEIYQNHYKKNEKEISIHLSSWPEQIKIEKNKADEEIYSTLLETIGLVRQKKSEAKKSMKAPIILTLEKNNKKLLTEVIGDLKAVTNSIKIEEGSFNVEFTEENA